MSDQSKQLKKITEEWAAAELNSDPAFFESLLTDDFVTVGPLGFTLNKEQWLGRYEGGLAFESFALDELEARFHGDAAVATCRQTQEGTYQGEAVEVMQGEFRATLVFVRYEGRWLLAGWHASRMAGMPPGQ